MDWVKVKVLSHSVVRLTGVNKGPSAWEGLLVFTVEHWFSYGYAFIKKYCKFYAVQNSVLSTEMRALFSLYYMFSYIWCMIVGSCVPCHMNGGHGTTCGSLLPLWSPGAQFRSSRSVASTFPGELLWYPLFWCFVLRLLYLSLGSLWSLHSLGCWGTQWRLTSVFWVLLLKVYSTSPARLICLFLRQFLSIFPPLPSAVITGMSHYCIQVRNELPF